MNLSDQNNCRVLNIQMTVKAPGRLVSMYHCFKTWTIFLDISVVHEYVSLQSLSDTNNCTYYHNLVVWVFMYSSCSRITKAFKFCLFFAFNSFIMKDNIINVDNIGKLNFDVQRTILLDFVKEQGIEGRQRNYKIS